MEFGKHIKWRQEKFGAVIFDTLKEKVFVTDEIGKDVLSLLADGMDVAAATERLCAEYDGDEAQIRCDVLAFVHELQENGLLASCVEEKA